MQGIVPPHHWQAARSTGAFSLVGCTVSPGFRFEGFELAPPDFTIPADVSIPPASSIPADLTNPPG